MAGERDVSPERVAWLRDETIAVRTINPADDEFSDLRPLAGVLAGARMVILGEATHGDGSTFLAKARLVRYLHREMGFDRVGVRERLVRLLEGLEPHSRG